LPILAGRKIIAMKICGLKYILVYGSESIDKSHSGIMKGIGL
jgi:hypothetical protein